MSRKKALVLTDHELRLMEVLWQSGRATVAEVVDRLTGPPLAYSTVLTTLRTLEQKGYIVHEEEGRAYVYHPLVARDEAAKSAQALFAGGGDSSSMPTTTITTEELESGLLIVDALALTKQCPSKSEARRLVQQGGVAVNDEKITAIDHKLGPSDIKDGKIIIRKGKKDYHAIKLAE